MVEILVEYQVPETPELKNVFFKRNIYIAGEKATLSISPNLQQKYEVGHYRCTQTPAYNGQGG